MATQLPTITSMNVVHLNELVPSQFVSFVYEAAAQSGITFGDASYTLIISQEAVAILESALEDYQMLTGDLTGFTREHIDAVEAQLRELSLIHENFYVALPA